MACFRYRSRPFRDAPPPASSTRSTLRSGIFAWARAIISVDWIMEASWPAAPMIAFATFSAVGSA